MTEKREKKKGDRYDGYLVHSTDPMHIIMPYLLGDRTSNEAYLCDNYDMTAVDALLAKKNGENPQYRYTYFHIILAALAKTAYNRPLLNRYIAGHRYYDRDNISFTFTVKNKFSDTADESLIIMKIEEDGASLLQQCHDKVCAEAYKIKEEHVTDDTTATLEWITKIPRPILRLVVRLLNWLQYHDWLPKSIAKIDPYSSSVWISNLGSIKTQANYHHLINWSKNSIFVISNQCKVIPFFNPDGTYEMRNSMAISFTIDERIADGFYFARSLDLFKYYLEHPEYLDMPIDAETDYKKEK